MAVNIYELMKQVKNMDVTLIAGEKGCSFYSFYHMNPSYKSM